MDLAFAPVERIPTDPEREELRPAIALCLSGGGYRAMLFHLGALWRLNELGYLPKLDRISSVSGGSITAGLLALHWTSLQFDPAGVAPNFELRVVRPLRSLAGATIDLPAILWGGLGLRIVGNLIAAAYDRRLFHGRTLQALPDHPRFVFNATNLQSGALWRFSKPYMRDWRVGEVPRPELKLAVAVAASSAFPPILSPVILRLKDEDFTPGSGRELQRSPYTTRVVLTDGGVYDNLGLETVWKQFRTVLVSDGGGRFAPSERPMRNWLGQTFRVLSTIDNQVRSLRKRQVVEAYRRGARSGAYWGAWTDIAEYDLSDALPCPPDRTLALARLPTRLAATDPATQERLINWGYAVCDAAMRAYVDRSLPRPNDFPYPEVGVG
jgi:NTE family protein